MNWCQKHWDMLREDIDRRGMSSLIAPDAQEVAVRTLAQLATGEADESSFDPLIAAWSNININIGEILSAIGGDPLYFLNSGPEDPVEGYGKKYEGRTWPHCPVCYISLVHEVTCKNDPRCKLPKVDGYDFVIEKGGQVAEDHAKELGLIGA